MKVWLNGGLVDAEAARIRPDDRGFTLADGLFETMALRDGAICRQDAHLARLRAACEILGLTLPLSDGALWAALAETVAANGLSDATLRLTVTRGPAPRGLRPPEAPEPTVLIAAAEWPPGSPDPVTAVIARDTRRNEHSPLARVKSMNYGDGILAAREAAGRGADDALLLNTAGNLAEATAANLFAVIGTQTVTPPVRDGALPGVMRAVVMAELGAAERSLPPAALEAAREVFLTSASGIRPVVRIDGGEVGTGRPGLVWRSLGGLIEGRETR